MIATILPGSSNFHAIGYNERKVSKGVARLIEILNFDSVGVSGRPTTEELTRHLQTYSERNSRIKKAQFHIAISCKGNDMTEEQLLDFAHRYMKEMGYMDPGQPILVYSHYDTSNTHLHIVTSRVAPDGRKINDHNERRRSQEVINRILGEDTRKKVEQDFEMAKQYKFNSFAQFKAVMSSLGYEVYQKNDTVFFKRGGKVQMKVPLADFNSLYKYGVKDKARARQLRQILRKYRDTCADKEELKKEIKDKFGVDIVFFGKKDKPYGYAHDMEDIEEQISHEPPKIESHALILSSEERRNRILRQCWAFRAMLTDCHPFELMKALLTDARFETLMKAGNHKAVSYFLDNKYHLDDCWNSHKIAMRNGYKIENYGLWCDLIRLLEKAGRDIRSAKYICPNNLQIAHDLWLNKVSTADEKRRRAEDLERAKKNEEQFIKTKSRYFGIVIKDREIEVSVLDSIEAYKAEGDAMHHCVFQCNYFDRVDSIVLSAHDKDGNRIETVEYSLTENKVIQSRGVCNKNTEYHDRIVNLVNANAHRFIKATA